MRPNTEERITSGELASFLLAEAQLEAATLRAKATLLEIKLRHRLGPEDVVDRQGKIHRGGAKRAGLAVVPPAGGIDPKPAEVVPIDAGRAEPPATIPPPAPAASDDGCEDA